MKAYTITISQIDDGIERTKNFVPVDPYKDKSGETKQYDYRTEEKQVEVTTTIYTQRTEQDIDLKSIIDAFNNFL